MTDITDKLLQLQAACQNPEEFRYLVFSVAAFQAARLADCDGIFGLDATS